MPAYNFKSRFAALVQTGQKTQTIRKPRKYPTHPGDYLKLYTGMRTKLCRLLNEGVCTSVTPITIGAYIYLDGNRLSDTEAETLARADGFGGISEFISFFEQTYGLPVEMELIKWASK